MLRRCLLLVVVNLLAFGALAGLTEGVYRFQLVDTFQQELRAANPALPSPPQTTEVLVLGDSFSAGSKAYPALLDRRLATNGFTIVNAAVSGFTVRDALRIAPRRVERFKPRVAIYQIYLGNDLLETRPPFKNAGSLARRVYWRATHNGWSSLAWLNYRLRGFSPESIRARRQPPPSDFDFDPATYQSRERRWIATYPSYLLDQRQLLDQAAWSSYAGDLDRLINELAKTADTVVLLVIPHCTEVAPSYRARFEALGLPFGHQPPIGGGGAWRDALQLAAGRLAAQQDPNIVLVDALSGLVAEEARGNPTYLANDPHLNRHGQRVLADLVSPLLLELLNQP